PGRPRHPEIDQRTDGVGDVERERDQLALGVAQAEGLLEHRDQDVVAGGDEAPEEEHRDEDAELRPACLRMGHVILPCREVVVCGTARHAGPRTPLRRYSRRDGACTGSLTTLSNGVAPCAWKTPARVDAPASARCNAASPPPAAADVQPEFQPAPAALPD